MNPFIQIENYKIGYDFEPVIIAEIGINHEGCLKTAKEMAISAINAGAKIIKHQTHIVDDEMSDEAKSVIPGNADVSIYEIMSRCALGKKDEEELMNFIKDRGATFISTPFSRAAVDRLVEFDVPAFKIGSGECNNYPLINYIASFNKPVILSTGMNTINSIRPSVEILRKNNIPYALLHCTNVYPTPPQLIRLNSINILKKEFPDAVIGLSDHSTSNYPSYGAIALGASIIERHYTDKMTRKGPDIICSMNPKMLKDLIIGKKIIFQARDGEKKPVKAEEAAIAFAFASVVAIKDIEEGETLTSENIWVKRPASGDYSASDYENLIGKRSLSFISKGTQLKKNQIEK
tara:strand:+ start:1395 stop:2438 length:1044 start_codon:yes stop_codon:yes gene_type:complete